MKDNLNEFQKLNKLKEIRRKINENSDTECLIKDLDELIEKEKKDCPEKSLFDKTVEIITNYGTLALKAVFFILGL